MVAPDEPMLTVTCGQAFGLARLSLRGELDVSTAAQLADAVDAAVDAGAEVIRFDCARLTFLDSTGVKVFVRARILLEGRSSRPVTIANASDSVVRVLTVVGLGDLLG